MKHMLLKQSILFVALMGISTGATMLYISQSSSGKENNAGLAPLPDQGDETLTPADALFMSITSLKQFNVNGSLAITYGENQSKTSISIDGVADVSDLENVKVSADMAVDSDMMVMNGRLGYFDQTIYVDYNNSHIKLPQADAMDFVNVLPSMGVEIAIPEELQNLDINALSQKLETLEPVATPDGGNAFTLEVTPDIKVILKADANNQFTGARTEDFFFQGMYVTADFDITPVAESVLTNPEKVEGAPKYQLFTPALGLVQGMYNVFGKQQNQINLNLDLKKQNVDVVDDIINLDTNISYDRSANIVNLKADIHETGRVHNLNLYTEDGVLYINHSDANKIAFSGQGIYDAITYLSNQITEPELTALLDKIAASMTGVNMDEVMGMLDKLTTINNWVEGIETTENSIKLTLNLTTISPKLSKVVIILDKDSNGVMGIHVNDFKFNGFIANVDMDVVDYAMPTIDKQNYVSLDPTITLVETVYKLTQQERFRVELSGTVDNVDPSINDITIGGGLQFDVKNRFGYGDMTIVDADSHSHKIQADVATDQAIRLAYNDELRFNMTTNTITEITNFVTQLMNTKDEHFVELFGHIVEKIEQLPIYKALTGDYGLLFATPGISNINVTSTIIEMDLSGALVGMPDMTMHMAIRYDDSHLYGLDVTNIVMNGQTISMHMDLKSFEDKFEATRLDPSLRYFDLTDLKFLLEIGYNTTVPNDFHIQGSVNIDLLGIIKKPLPIDVRIENRPKDRKSNVYLAISFPSVPVISLVNNNTGYTETNGRSVTFYYADGNVYGQRIDKVAGLFGVNPRTEERSFREDYKTFLQTDNILNYLLDFTLGLRPAYINKINEAVNAPKDPAAPNYVRIEKVLNAFSYNAIDNYYHLELNMAEVASNAKLQPAMININVDTVTRTIKGIQLDWNVVKGVNLKAKIDLVNFGQDVDLADCDAFALAHLADKAGVTVYPAVKA